MKDGKDKKPKISELIKERELLLKEHPELKSTQKKIDSHLSKAGKHPKQRAKVILEHMLEQYEKEISPALDEMKSIKNVMNEIRSTKKRR